MKHNIRFFEQELKEAHAAVHALCNEIESNTFEASNLKQLDERHHDMTQLMERVDDIHR